ncbi:hypothetical protein CUR178_03388 [Leishmania enriettii]|uniref:Uncharacterized protein n=1 Tax=Leishmania enriettii TaxID=5663 RepID=A0A836GQU5_LEIEN|nr:hypothetical protein CUR178_03388 [Leishmania enriettii]
MCSQPTHLSRQYNGDRRNGSAAVATHMVEVAEVKSCIPLHRADSGTEAWRITFSPSSFASAK